MSINIMCDFKFELIYAIFQFNDYCILNIGSIIIYENIIFDSERTFRSQGFWF